MCWPVKLNFVIPRIRATTVPITSERRIAIRANILNSLRTKTTSSVNIARPMLPVSPKSGLATGRPFGKKLGCPVIHFPATGRSDSPMTVMIDPVTTGGKKRTMLAKNGTIRNAMRPAMMIAPYAVRRPSWPCPATIAVRVDTEAKEMPCTRGSCAPRYGTPSVCSTVATPLTNKEQEIRKAMSAPFNPAAPPTMMGTAITPPNIDRMCCIP